MMDYRCIDIRILKKKNLSVTARCILLLLYFSSNRNNIASLNRQQILNYLGIGLTGYYPHYRQLTASGIITVNRKGKGKDKSKNFYRFAWKYPATVNSAGIIYKKIITSQKLAPISKLLYTYITAFCPNYKDSWTFQKTDICRDLNISDYLLKKGFNELEKKNLIIVNRKYPYFIIVNNYNPNKKVETKWVLKN